MSEELIRAAAAYLNPVWVGDRWFGDVASALVTADGAHFYGVCIDTGSGTGFCAEAAAIGAMVTAGERRIAQIVAVWRDPDTARLHVLPPCGRCRLFISQIHPDNAHQTMVVLGAEHQSVLADLIPHQQWPPPLDASF
ncbi:MAG: cytidine deaminase [Dermatophilaceae bacterium]